MATVYTDRLSDTESRSIRVFDFQSPRSRTEETIRGRLRTVSLDDNPSYVALSYAWGDKLPPHDIECGDQVLTVTTNCIEALEQLRRSFGMITIWVDSICINQSDTREQEHQISLMRDIYDKAEKVYVWLGKGDQETDYAMDWLVDATREESPMIAFKIKHNSRLWFLRPRDFPRLSRVLLEQAVTCM
jgi:hypothetical protein